jgi:hypothetical protein
VWALIIQRFKGRCNGCVIRLYMFVMKDIRDSGRLSINYVFAQLFEKNVRKEKEQEHLQNHPFSM